MKNIEENSEKIWKLWKKGKSNIFHNISQFSSVFSKSFHYSTYFSSAFSKSFHFSTYFSSIFLISFHISTLLRFEKVRENEMFYNVMY
jgi:hypothetical protein